MFSANNQQATAQGATPAALQGPPPAQQAHPTPPQEDSRLLEYTKYEHDDSVVLVHAKRAQSLHCACGARLSAITELGTLQRSVTEHFAKCREKPTFDTGDLKSFLHQVHITAQQNTLLVVPFRFDLAIGKPLPDWMFTQLIQWCLGCGKSFGASKSISCPCVVKRRVSLSGLVGTTQFRIVPIP